MPTASKMLSGRVFDSKTHSQNVGNREKWLGYLFGSCGALLLNAVLGTYLNILDTGVYAFLPKERAAFVLIMPGGGYGDVCSLVEGYSTAVAFLRAGYGAFIVNYSVGKVYPCIYRGGKPTCLAYATSDSPLGPFTYRGILVDNAKCDPQSWNIHGSIQEWNGQWYVFYHRSSKNSCFHRRLCVEKIRFNADGTIDEVKMTSQGAGLPFSGGERIEGWRACEVEGGAYIDGTDLVLCDGSAAYIRYVQLKDRNGVRIESEGNGAVRVFADGVPLERCSQGLHEIKLVCRGDLKIKSITFAES